MAGTSNSDTISPKLQRIAELAKRAPEMAITTLAHHITGAWVLDAYERTRKNGAIGVDGVTAEEWNQHRVKNAKRLVDALKSGTYRAPPVRRVYIPKGSGKELRPIGIPTFEDKLLQRVMVTLLEPVYEQDFLDCSHGFRPGRSPHTALKQLRDHIMEMKGGWVLEIDFRKFFDTLDHKHLMGIVSQRVRDGVVLRSIGKWLNAGVMEENRLSYPEAGTPQGGVISPLLANIYLHTVLDTWFYRVVTPRLFGRAHLVRYADDAVMVFQCEEDARRVLEVLPKRCGKYGLTLHPEKTRLVPFRRPPLVSRRPKGSPSRRVWKSFDFLSFTHYWGRSQRDNSVVFRSTAAPRMVRATKAIGQWLRKNRHRPLDEQHRTLRQKLTGHFQYFGIVGNSRKLWRLRHLVIGIWRKWLSRRSQTGAVSWKRMKGLLTRYPLPKPPSRLLVA